MNNNNFNAVNCAEHPHPEWWFPGPNQTVLQRQAKTVCHHCPVRIACLNHALDNHEQYGIWGGHTERERRRVRRIRNQQLPPIRKATA